MIKKYFRRNYIPILTKSILLILSLSLVSEAFSQWNENVELVNYPIRQKTCLGVVEEGILYGNTRIGVEIFDVSDPANMVEMGNLPLAHNYPLGTNYVTSPWIGLHDGHLYIRAETPASVDSFDIYIVDVNEPLKKA